MESMFKAIIVSIIAGGVLIASFYTAYLLLILVVLGIVFGIAYTFFNRATIFSGEDWPE